MKPFLTRILALTMSIATFGLCACLGTTESSSVDSSASSQQSESASSAQHTHSFGEWTRVGDGACEEVKFKRACATCNAMEIRQGTADDHVFTYVYDVTDHWQICTVCGKGADKQPHVLTSEGTCEGCLNLYPTDCVTYEISDDETHALVTGYNEAETNSVVIAPIYNGLPVQGIKAEAFKNCTSLTAVTLPDGITYVGESAFQGCTSLMGIYLRSSVKTVGNNAFHGCAELSIFCESDAAPEGFSANWNSAQRPVYWGYQGKTMLPVSYASTTASETPFVATSSNTQLAENTDLNGVSAPEGFFNVYRFDGKADKWEKSALWSYNYNNTNLSQYSDVWFAMKIVGGSCTFVDGTPSPKKSPWIYVHLKQVGVLDEKDDSRLWDVEFSFGGQVWVSFKNQSGAALDKDRGVNSIARLLWHNAFSSVPKTSALIYHNVPGVPPTIYCTEIRVINN